VKKKGGAAERLNKLRGGRGLSIGKAGRALRKSCLTGKLLIDFSQAPPTVFRFDPPPIRRGGPISVGRTIMKQLSIQAASRSKIGSAHAGRLRASGKVPAVAYGRAKPPVHLTVEASELSRLLRAIGNNTPICRLSADEGPPRISIIEEVQRHPITDQYLHVDFHEVADDEPISISVPVHSRGEAFGVKNENGTLEHVSLAVEARCLPNKAPDYIEVDVSDLRLGDTLHVRELPEIDGVVYLDDPEQPVFTVSGEEA